MTTTLAIASTWDGAPARPDEMARVEVDETADGLAVEIDAPLHGDPPPSAPPGPTWALWDHEVVELFVLGPGDRYTEVELGPGGHHLLLRLEGRRNIVERLLPLDAEWSGDTTRWTARFTLAHAILPPRPWRINAMAIHGVGAARRYLAWTPMPGPAPDFHRLDAFSPFAPPHPGADALIAAFAAAGDPARTEHAKGYFPSALTHLGVATPDLRAALKPTLVAARKWTPGQVHALVFALHRGGVFEGRQAAFDLLDALPRARRALREPEILALAEGNDNWASVDAFSCGVSGRAWREGQLSDAVVHGWATSPDRWLRRTALASTIPLNLASRGGTGDTTRTLAVCTRLVADRDDLVVKALSWALRTLAPHDPAAVRAFLAVHAVAPRVRREVTTKLVTGRKRPDQPAGALRPNSPSNPKRSPSSPTT